MNSKYKELDYWKLDLSKIVPKDKNGKVGLDAGMKIATKFFLAIMTLGILGFALIIVLGNLQGSSGFAAGSDNANRSDNVLSNLTAGAESFFSNAGSWFTLLSVVIIIAIVTVVITVVRSTGGGSNREL